MVIYNYQKGNETKEDLIAKDGKQGLIVYLYDWGLQINPNTGDYSRGASGFLGGKMVRLLGPVNECTIAGNLLEMLKKNNSSK